MKIWLTVYILCTYLYAQDTFVSIKYMNSLGDIYSEKATSDGSNYLSVSDAHSVTLALGQKINFFDTMYRIEPNIGYTYYEHNTYEINMFSLELPLLYKFNMFNQKISFGPGVKLYYIKDVEELDQIYASGTTFNGSYIFKIIFENKLYDYFIYYERINGDIHYYDREDSLVTTGHIGTKGNYAGIGLRVKY